MEGYLSDIDTQHVVRGALRSSELLKVAFLASNFSEDVAIEESASGGKPVIQSKARILAIVTNSEQEMEEGR